MLGRILIVFACVSNALAYKTGMCFDNWERCYEDESISSISLDATNSKTCLNDSFATTRKLVEVLGIQYCDQLNNRTSEPIVKACESYRFPSLNEFKKLLKTNPLGLFDMKRMCFQSLEADCTSIVKGGGKVLTECDNIFFNQLPPLLDLNISKMTPDEINEYILAVNELEAKGYFNSSEASVLLNGTAARVGQLDAYRKACILEVEEICKKADNGPKQANIVDSLPQSCIEGGVHYWGYINSGGTRSFCVINGLLASRYHDNSDHSCYDCKSNRRVGCFRIAC